jgi:hypothetical protein
MIKLHARDRAKLVALAYETGFVQPGQSGTEIELAPPIRRGSDLSRRSRYSGTAAAGGRSHVAPGDLRVRAPRTLGAAIALARQVEQPV